MIVYRSNPYAWPLWQPSGANESRNFWQNSTYPSTLTTEHGMEYQKEVAFHIWLKLVSQDCRPYALYYELKDCHKFDDIGVHFESNGQEYALYLQTKHHINGNDRFDIKKHIASLLDGNIQKLMPKLDGKLIKYVFLTTVRKPIANPEEIYADVQPYSNIFERFTNAGARIFRLGEQNKGIVEDLVKNAESNELGLSVEYILENVLIISHSPKLKKLRMINNGMIKELYPNVDNRHLICIVRNNFCDAINTCNDTTACVRKTLNHNDFLLNLSFLEYQLEEISKEYCRIFASWITFRKDILDCVKGHQYIVYDQMQKFNILKLVQAVRQFEANFFIIPYNRLCQCQRNLLVRFKKKTIIVLDDETVDDTLWNNPNLIFVVKKNKCSAQSAVHHLTQHCCIEELEDSSRNMFLNSKVRIQNSELTVQEMKDYLLKFFDAPSTHTIIGEILQRMAETNYLQYFGREPKKINVTDNTKFQFVRRRKRKKVYFDEESLSKLWRCVVFAGEGRECKRKSAAMKIIAQFVKNSNPLWWIEVISARACGKALCKYLKYVELTENVAKNFLFDHIISYGTDKVLDKFLLEKYLSLHDQGVQEIPIFLIFNCFDHVSIRHDQDEELINLIGKLCRLGIKVFISAHFTDRDILKELPNFEFVNLKVEAK